MPLYKSSQVLNAEDDFFGDEDEVILYEEKPSKEDVIEMHQPDVIEVSFKLPPLPGSDADMPIEVSTGDPIEVKEENDNSSPEKEIEVSDPWDWQSGGDVLGWVKQRLGNIPRHSGKETTGIERAIAYLKRLNNEMSKAVSSDYDGKIDVSKFEDVRKEIYSAIDRLEDAKEKLEQAHYKKKKGASNPDMVKEGQKATHVGGIIITVPLLISAIARICINSTVSAGKDIEKTADQLISKYKLDDGQQLELMQLLSDMGYPLRRPRGFKLDENIDPTSADNFDWMPNYTA